MSLSARKHQAEKQRRLRVLCHHPDGTWRPLNWQAAEISIPEQITNVAKESPHQLALFDSKISFSFLQLENYSNRIAQAILEIQGSDPQSTAQQDAVALLLSIDAPAVAASLGVMKTGNFFVAIEETLPQKRALQILENAEASLIISDQEHIEVAMALAGVERKVINLDTLQSPNADPLNIPIPLESVAMLVYTSGSTGQPKGVVLSHRTAFAQTVAWHTHFHICSADRFANFLPISSGGGVIGVFGALCLGAGVGNFDLRQHGWQQLANWLHEWEISFLPGRIVSRQFKNLDPLPQFPRVRLLTMGGDTIFRTDIEFCKRLFPQAMIGIGYGLTETGRVTEYFLEEHEIPEKKIVPIGYPLPWVKIYLLSEDGQGVKEGEIGEIVIQWEYLSEGYWHNQDLTAERYQHEGPWGEGRVYFTGDLGRFLPDGKLQHMGRKDFMVKIRGYQVFTNEIDALLQTVNGVEDVCVTRKDLPDGTQRLVAYLVINEAQFPGPEALHKSVKDIPDYMKPGVYEYLDALPKTNTAKTDRRQLPLPQLSRLNVTARYKPPRNQAEETMVRIWGEVLGIEEIGVDDNFLELGGDSLQSIRIINKVNETLQGNISYREFFQALTIAEMACCYPQ